MRGSGACTPIAGPERSSILINTANALPLEVNMLYFWLIPVAVLAIVLFVLLYNLIMKRHRSPEESADTPHQRR